MNDYLPDYRRGESLIGYMSRCSAQRKMVLAVPSAKDRMNICGNHAEQMRVAISQPFKEEKKK
jgi:hypothetical protein